MKAAIAPMAELSTSEVQPLTKGTIMTTKMKSGIKPARKRRSFSAIGRSRSCFGNTGPRLGVRRQRIAI
jgi:hypothetical protein